MSFVLPIADFRLTLAGRDLRGDIFAAVAEALDITAKVRPRLLSLTLTEKRGGEADQLDILIDDSDGGMDLPAKGAALQLKLGWRAGSGMPVDLVDKGRFLVDEVEWSGAPDQIRITARSADLTNSFRVRREASYRDTTLGNVAQKVAQAHGWTPRIAPALASIAVKVLAQNHQSDMALLRRLGREHDAAATVKNRVLILSPIGKATTASGRTLPGIALTRRDGSGFVYREVDRSADAGVEARWHDQDSGDRKTVKVGGDGKGKPHRLRRVYHTEAEAQAAAKAAHGRKGRAEAEFEITLGYGRPDYYPERPVTLTGFKKQVDARHWIIAELSHSLDGSGGLMTKLKLETAG